MCCFLRAVFFRSPGGDWVVLRCVHQQSTVLGDRSAPVGWSRPHGEDSGKHQRPQASPVVWGIMPRHAFIICLHHFLSGRSTKQCFVEHPLCLGR